MDIANICQNLLKWSWDLITGLGTAINWLFTTNETLSDVVNALLNTELDVAPIYLIGGGAFVGVLIAGIIRAIV